VSEAGFRIVAAYRDALQVETAVELLRSAGIEARVPDAYGANPLPSLALGWVRILVREADAGPARDLLRALMFDLQARTRAVRRSRLALCEACGSEAVVPAPWAVWPGRLSLWGFRLPLPRYGPSRRCLVCGHLGPRVRGGPRPEPPLHPAFERAIAVYEAGLRGRLVRALKRVAAHKMREAVRTALAEEAARRRKSVAERYEAVRKDAVTAVAAGLDAEADRDLLAAQADLAWDEILALERRSDALTGPARRILTRLAAEARRRANLSE
jgi:hypothetical protein